MSATDDATVECTEANAPSAPTDQSIRPLSDFPDMATFTTTQKYPALIAPTSKVATLRKKLSKIMIRIPRVKSVYPSESSPDERILVLENEEALSEPVVQDLLKQDCRVTEYAIELGYKDMKTEDILKKILPKNVTEIPGAFETVGHLAHLNLRDDCLPFKYWIGKVILDKNQPRIRTVVNKLASIENEFRTFDMEVIAGDDKEGWSQVSVREEGCTFALDFRQVYWNSRLAGEHKRLVSAIHEEAEDRSRPIVVADLMAGVGPFAVPLTAHNSSKVIVYANDLNPTSFKYLQINQQKNKCKNLHCYNQDGRAFTHWLSQQGIRIDHVIMNLPATAPEFLDAFRGFNSTTGTLPRIHVHCFAPKDLESTDYQCAIDRCSDALGHKLDRKDDSVHIRVVRDVGPNKNMLCVSFQLPKAVCDLPPIQLPERTTADDVTPEEPEAKRQKSS